VTLAVQLLQELPGVHTQLDDFESNITTDRFFLRSQKNLSHATLALALFLRFNLQTACSNPRPSGSPEKLFQFNVAHYPKPSSIAKQAFSC
jgi:hypothetical protein